MPKDSVSINGEKKELCLHTAPSSEKSLVVFVLAVLICDTAAGLTSRLTRCLTLSTSAVLDALL